MEPSIIFGAMVGRARSDLPLLSGGTQHILPQVCALVEAGSLVELCSPFFHASMGSRWTKVYHFLIGIFVKTEVIR